MVRLALVVISMGIFVSGCASTNFPASVREGECKIFPDPGFRVRGLRIQDNRWIATTQETGIEVCGWKRPSAEPLTISCDNVRKVVLAFNGDVAAAENYARTQGASSDQIVQVRACLTIDSPPPTKATVVPLKKRWFKRQQKVK